MDAASVGERLLECLGEPDPESLLSLSLAELEKRHILRVLASSRGNKTAAARVLGIDTKTLYNKLKGYQVSEKNQQVRQDLGAGSGASGPVDASGEAQSSEGHEGS
jgi:DNA-binding NtrC family response regulator